MALLAALAKVRDAPFLLDAIRATDALTAAAGQDGGPHAVKVLTRVVDDLIDGRDDDQLMAIAAVHALGAVFDDGAGAALSDLLSDPRPFLREHAAWALGSRTPRLDAVGRLVSGVAAGGFSTVISQRALRRWAQTTPDHIALALEGALLSRDDAAGRARLVETMGLVPGAVAARTLHRVAADTTEPLRSRMAAVAALGDRGPDGDSGALIRRLARTTGELGGVARLAAFDVAGTPIGALGHESGIVVAQLFLHADLDRELSRAGAGDNGGIATMLVRLGDALAGRPGISRVVTMSRGTVDAAVDALTDPPADHVLAPDPVDVGADGRGQRLADVGGRRAGHPPGAHRASGGRPASADGGRRQHGRRGGCHPVGDSDRLHPGAGSARGDPRPGHDRCAHPRHLRDRRRTRALLVPDRTGPPARRRRPPQCVVPATETARSAA